MSVTGVCSGCRLGVCSFNMKAKVPLLSTLIILVLFLGGFSSALAGTARPFASMTNVFDGPVSQFFGVNPDGSAKNTNSYYRSTTPYLIFDTANNQIFCSLSRTGLVESCCVIDNAGMFRGSSPWPFTINTGGGDVRLDSLTNSQCNLLGNFFPLQTYAYSNLVIQQLVFAPCSTNTSPVKPRAVIISFRMANNGTSAVTVMLKSPANLVNVANATTANSLAQPTPTNYPPRWPTGATGHFAAGYEAITLLDGAAWNPAQPSVTFTLGAGTSNVISFAGFTGGTIGDLQLAATQVSQQTALQWLNQTWASYAGRLGSLTIPADPFSAELFERLAIVAHHSVMGSTNYAHVVDDGAHLLMAMIDPITLRNYVSANNTWTMSADPYHSVYDCFYGTPVAGGEYYQTTGDTNFFIANPAFLSGVTNAVADLFSYSQRTPHMLFYAQQIWDSLARGDWHTGSNIYLWYCFNRWAQIAQAAYGDAITASNFNNYADSLQSDLNTYMVGTGPLGTQYFEGVYTNGTFEKGHDGEEGASSMAPFYGFCRADESRLLNYKQRALCPDNPIYNTNLDAINWLGNTNHSQPWAGWLSGPTSPSWVAALAGAASEGEVYRWVKRIGQITDLDGSIWWWPYKLTNTVYLGDVKRSDADATVGKVGYTASMFGAEFYFKIMGLTFDYPTRSIFFAPLCPWDDVKWNECRLGNSLFNIGFHRQAGSITGEIVNANSEPFLGTFELPVPSGANATSCTLNGQPVPVTVGTMYGRTSYQVSQTLGAGQTNTFVVNYTAGQQLLTNPDLEAVTNGWVSSGSSTITNNALKAHTGNDCIMITSQGGYQDQMVTNGFTVGNTYALSGYGRMSATNGTGYGYLGLKCWSAASVKLQESDLSFTQLCYVQATTNVTIPAGTSYLEIYAWLGTGGKASFYADDLSLMPVGPADANGDGLPDEWELTWFGTTTYGATNSYAGDGISNQAKYIAGVNPTTTNDFPRLNPVSSSQLSFATVAARGSGYEGLQRYYTLQQCSDLTLHNWSAVTNYQDVIGTGQTVNYTNLQAATLLPGFYRLRIYLSP